MIESPLKALYYCLAAFVIFVFLGVLEHYIPIFYYAHRGFILLGELVKAFLDSAIIHTTTDMIIKSIGGAF